MPDSGHLEMFDCPHCGEPVPSTARVCRHCGASDEYGWGDSEVSFSGDGYDEADFDYDEFVANEFPSDVSDQSVAAKKASLFRLVILAIIISLLITLI